MCTCSSRSATTRCRGSTPSRPRIPNVFANRLSIDHLDRAAAHAAIVGPIDRWNEISSPEDRVGIEAGLVTAVLDEVAAAPAGNGSSAAGLIEAPYLQLVMERVWEEEQAAGSQLLRLSTLERLGGARAIVSAHLEADARRALEPHDAAIAASALTYLVTPSRTKIAQSFDDLAGYTDESPAELRSVLDLLAAQRILRVASIGRREGRRYEIFHDVLAEPVLAWRRGFTGSCGARARAEARPAAPAPAGLTGRRAAAGRGDGSARGLRVLAADGRRGSGRRAASCRRPARSAPEARAEEGAEGRAGREGDRPRSRSRTNGQPKKNAKNATASTASAQASERGRAAARAGEREGCDHSATQAQKSKAQQQGAEAQHQATLFASTRR